MNSLEAYEKLQNLKLELLEMKSSVNPEHMREFTSWCVKEFVLGHVDEENNKE